MAPRASAGLTETAFTALTPSEKERVAQEAKARRVTPSAFIRALISADLDAVPETAAEYVHAVIMANVLPTAENKLRLETLTRAAESEGTAQTPGLLGSKLMGPLISSVDKARRVAGSSNGGEGPAPMPISGPSFIRPRIAQEGAADEQSAEFAQPASQAMTIVGDTIAKGGPVSSVVRISEQNMDWTDPALLQLALNEHAAIYGARTEAKACAAVEAGATNSVACSLTAAPAVFHVALTAALAEVYASSLTLPDSIYCAPDRLAYVLGLVTADGGPVYPDGRPLALQLVPSPTFSAGFIAVGASQYVETYEQLKGHVQAPSPPQVNPTGGPNVPVDPATLAFLFAFRGYFAARALPQGLCALAA